MDMNTWNGKIILKPGGELKTVDEMADYITHELNGD